MNNDLRQQILVSLRADGVGEADKLREAMARIKEEVANLARGFGAGTVSFEELRKESGRLGTSLNFCTNLLKENEATIQAVDVGLHKLQVTAIGFGDAYRAAMERAAQASDALELKEAERVAKSIQQFEDWLARHESGAAADEIKEAERLARLATAHDAMLAREEAAELAAAEAREARLARRLAAELAADARREASATALELAEAERLARLAGQHDAMLEREEAAGAAAELAEAERLARLAAQHETMLGREEAAGAEAALKEAERLAKLATQHDAMLAREAAAGEAAALAEAERLAKLAAQHEAMLAREEAAEVAAALAEAERLAKLATQHEAMLARQEAADLAAIEAREAQLARQLAGEIAAGEREAAAAVANAAEIASARASLNMQRRDSLDAAMVAFQNEALKTQRVISGIGTVADHSHEKANKFGYAILNISHAFQDLQYGIGAVLNNIPLVMTSLGFGPGAAGAVMALGVTAEVVRGQMGSLSAALGLADDPAKKLGASIAEVQEKVKALSGKTIMFAADFKDLDEAEKRLERLQKLKALVEGTKETDAEKSLSQVAQGIVTAKAGGSKAVAKAVGEIEATRGVEHGSQMDVNIVANSQDQIDRINKDIAANNYDWRNPIGVAQQMGAQQLMLMELTRRRDAAAERLKGAREGFVGEETGKFLAGDPEAIKRMKNRVAQFPGAFTFEGGQAIAAMPGSPEEMQARADKKVGVDQAAGLDAANKKDLDEWNRLEKAKRVARQQKKRADDAAAKRAATEREQAVSAQVNLFDTEFAQQRGPGSLDSAILARAGQGQAAQTIQADLGATMRRQMAGKVPADMVDEVADGIVKKAVDAVRAEVAAAGGGRAGVADVAAGRADKLNRAQDLAGKRAGRAEVGAYEEDLAGRIFDQAGGQFNPQAARAAAHRAVQNMKDGQGEHEATWNAVLATIEDLGREVNHMRQGLAGVRNRLNAQGAQNRRNRAQLPPALPQFP